MPSPVGHALGGLIVALVFAPPPPPHEGHEGPEVKYRRILRALRVPRAWWPVVAGLAAVACLSDVDFAWGRHNMETHSLGFALIVGLVALSGQRSVRVAVATALAVGTHVLFDWLGSDDSPPLGVMALWPLSPEFYYADAWLFGAISRHYWRSDFVAQNMLAVLREVAILGPFIAALWLYRRIRFAARRSA